MCNVTASGSFLYFIIGVKGLLDFDVGTFMGAAYNKQGKEANRLSGIKRNIKIKKIL